VNRIFIDMDGVIVDFDGYALKLNHTADEIEKGRAFRTAAQRRLVAATIASRPSGDQTRFAAVFFPGGMPLFFVASELVAPHVA
jgi:hypothetical protein